MSDAAGWMICNRSARRSKLLGLDGSVTLTTPDGTCSCRLMDLSLVGIAFVVPDEAPGLRVGDVRKVVVRVGSTEIQGSVQLVRIEAVEDADRVCGANLSPAGDHDRRALSDLINRLEGTPRSS